MTEPLVSIVMPTYNRKALIAHAIDSVVGQRYSNWELIVIDDGSTDGTVDFIRSHYGSDARIKVFSQPNTGQSEARNAAIEKSQGDFIAFLDSDNIWRSDRLEEGVALLMQYPHVGLCYSDETFIDINGDLLACENMRRYSGKVFSRLIVDNFITLNTVLLRKSILPGPRPFSASNHLDEDYELWLDLSVKNDFFYIPKALVAYRVEGARVSDHFMDRLSANERTIKKILNKYNLNMNDADVKRGLSLYYQRCALIEARHGNLMAVYKSLATSCKCKIEPFGFIKIIARIILVRLGFIK